MQHIKIKEFAGRVRDCIQQNSDTRLVFFLGAGCSISSGIPSAGGLVSGWIARLQKIKSLGESEWQTYLNQEFPRLQDNPAQHYEKAYQALFLSEQQGQQEIETLMDQGQPSFGYISLAQLMTQPEHGRQMNVVLTTNFDDLPAEALYLYTSARPRVIAHESLASYSRASEQRPLIVKLHGDAHLEPQSSGKGIRQLNPAMSQALARLLRNAMLVFIGYGGNDQSVATALREHQGQICEGGVFLIGSNQPGEAIQAWLKQAKAVQVDHRDFDEAMFYLRDAFALEHPDIQGRMAAQQKAYTQTYERLSQKARQELHKHEGSEAKEFMSLLAKTDKSLDWWKRQQEINKYANSDPERAEQMYRKAIAELPESHELLGNFAVFLKNIRQQHDEAERLYRRVLELQPDDADYLGNFALFLTDIRQQHDEAERQYQRALELEPDHANNLGNFANFLTNIRQQHDEAEKHYRRALELQPGHANNLGNFAKLLLELGREEEGFAHLSRAEALADLDDLELELAFYRYAYGPENTRQLQGLKDCHRLIDSGVRSPGWYLAATVARATQNGHAEPELLNSLAAVIAAEQDASDLNRFEEWRKLEG